MSVRERGRRALERLVEASATERALISFASLVLAIAVGTVIILVAGRMTTCREAAFWLTNPQPFVVPELFRMGFCYNPVTVFDRLFLGALGDPLTPGWDPLNGQFAVTLRETTVLVFTGLSVALAFRAGIFNIGTQGQLVVGALATALGVLWVAPFVSGVVGTVLLVPFGLLLGAIFGGLYGAIPGALKAYADANEVITTIMLNFIAAGVVYFLIDAYLKPPGAAAPNTAAFPDYVDLPGVAFGSPSFSVIGLAIALLTVLVVYVLMARTSFGYDLVTSGHQEPAAKYSGVDPKRMIVRTMTISGMVAGLAGAMFAIMILGYYSDPNSFPTFGFDAIAVSLLGANNPLAVVPAGILFGGLDAGGQYIGFTLDVPSELVDGVIGLIVLFVAVPELFRMAGRYTGLGGEHQ